MRQCSAPSAAVTKTTVTKGKMAPSANGLKPMECDVSKSMDCMPRRHTQHQGRRKAQPASSSTSASLAEHKPTHVRQPPAGARDASQPASRTGKRPKPRTDQTAAAPATAAPGSAVSAPGGARTPSGGVLTTHGCTICATRRRRSLHYATITHQIWRKEQGLNENALPSACLSRRGSKRETTP